MKKLITTAIALFTVLSLSWAQMRIHPVAGVNFSRYDEGYADKEIDGAAGLKVGLGLRFGDQVYIEPAVLYYQAPFLWVGLILLILVIGLVVARRRRKYT